MSEWFKKHKRMVFIALWLCATAITIMFCVENFKLLQLHRLITHGVRTEAVVTEKLPENHQRIRYSFDVDGKTYSWGGFASDLGKNFEQISIGQVIPITYEEGSPNNSCIGNAEPIFCSYVKFSIFLSFFPTAALIILALKYFDLPKNT